MEKRDARGEAARKGVASLFDDYEVKDLFRRYVYLLIVVEVLIFLVCWVYQLGLDEVAVTGKPVDVPFPWKMYFLVSFIAPVAVTFLVGIVVAAFNTFLYGRRSEPIFKEEGPDAVSSKLARIINFCFQLPFLLILVLLGVLVAVVYNMGDIIEFLGHFGEAAAKFLLIGFGCLLVAGTIFGVVRMVLAYKLRKKDMEYEYKREVMEKLGIAILDERTIIDSQGKMISGKQDIEIESKEPPRLPPACDTSVQNPG